MATYSISFESPDPFNPMNGVHHPIASGAAFIASYGDELTLAHSEVDTDDDMIAASIDALAIGDTLKVESSWCDVITVERLA